MKSIIYKGPNKDLIKKSVQLSYKNIEKIINDNLFLEDFSNLIQASLNAISNNSKIIFCGNGGSAAESQHFAAELTSKFKRNRAAINSISLTADTSAISSIGNDFGFEYIFSRQLDAIGTKGDVLIALSTSGKSKNILNACECADNKEILPFLWTGDHDLSHLSKIKSLKVIRFPSKETAFIQEQQLIMGHIFCEELEKSV
tara:strand:- start:225 stop:827 length:603 start_codon:yes stop_codon:yes gene_type:complete